MKNKQPAHPSQKKKKQKKILLFTGMEKNSFSSSFPLPPSKIR